MKTSNKLLMSLLLVGLLTLVGSAIALRAEYDKIDFNDPFYGFSTTSIKSFRVLKIEGSLMSEQSNTSTRFSRTVLGIQIGKTFEIRRQENNQIPFSYRFSGDTLLVQYKPEPVYWGISTDELFDPKPFAYVIVPSIQGLVATGTICTLTDLKTDQLQITSTDAHVQISKSTIDKLTATGQRGSLLRTTATNRIQAASIVSRDSTGFIAERDIFGSLSMQSDSNATLSIPASLLRKL